jgi:hypothetical protein
MNKQLHGGPTRGSEVGCLRKTVDGDRLSRLIDSDAQSYS